MNELVNQVKTGSGEVLTNPIKTPRKVVLKATVGSGKTNVFFDDACGLASSLGLVGTQTGTALAMTGSVTVANLKEFLKSFVIIVSYYNFNSSAEDDLSNDVQLTYSKVDGTSENDKLFSSLSVSNMQQNPDLLNVAQGFIWTNNCALKLDGTEGTVYTLTFAIRSIVPYAKLDEYLLSNPLYKTL